MQFRLRTLHLLLAVGPPSLAVLWFLSHSIAGMIGWMLAMAFFAGWFWMLRKSQSIRDEKD